MEGELTLWDVHRRGERKDLTLKKLIAETRHYARRPYQQSSPHNTYCCRLQSRTCIDQMRAIVDIEEQELQKEIDTVNVQMSLRMGGSAEASVFPAVAAAKPGILDRHSRTAPI